MNKILISIVIVTYNSSSLIKRCLESIISNNDIGDGLEIIIVDNNSADFEIMAETAKSVLSDCIIIRNKSNGGYGQGNNLGIKKASGSIIMIMNPDVILFKPIFKKVLKDFDNSKVGLVGGCQYERLGKRRLSFIALHYGFWNNLLLKIYNFFNSYNSKYLCIHGACFFIRKNIMEQIGYYDENIFLYLEEKDIHKRIQLLPDVKIIYDKHIGYIHPMEKRSASVKAREIGQISRIYYCNKYHINIEKVMKSLLFSNRISQILHIIRHGKVCKELNQNYEYFKNQLEAIKNGQS